MGGKGTGCGGARIWVGLSCWICARERGEKGIGNRYATHR